MRRARSPHKHALFGSYSHVLFAQPLDWADDALRETYATWLLGWISSLSPHHAVAFRLRLFGSAFGSATPSRRPADVLCAGGATPAFLPESAQMYAPVASSPAELAQRLTDALAPLL